MRKATKIVISFAVVLIAGLNFIVPAFAQDPFTAIAIGGFGGASGAGLFGSMAGMSGVDISWGNNTVDEMDAMWNVLNPDHVYFTGTKHEANPQQYPEDVYDYIEVDIGDWLSAQSDFIVNFITENQVTDNSYGQVSITKSYSGVPLTGSGNWLESPVLFRITSIPMVYRLGALVLEMTPSGNNVNYKSYNNGVLIESYTSSIGMNRNVSLQYNVPNGTIRFNVEGWVTINGGQVTLSDSSTANWTSTNVNSSVFDGWEKARVKIPHAESGLSVNWTIPDFLGAINTLWLNNNQGHLIIEDTDSPVPPPPVPVPSTPLGDVPFDDWVDLWGQGIYEQLENQSDALDLIGSNGEDQIEELESIDSNLGDLNQTTESIDTNIGIGNGILGGIRSLAQSAVNFLEGIAENVGELVEEIVEGTETLIAGILNQIPQAFGVIFGPIKQASSIWHYVVEWIQSIGAPFQFIWSMASGTSYYIILPVYASLAAAVVLAFYKRFGK